MGNTEQPLDSWRKTQILLEYVSLFESELFLEQPRFARDLAPSNRAAPPATKPEAPPPERGLNPHPAAAPYPNLEHMEAAIRGCLKCPLGTTRNRFVFGVGSKNARVVFVGEAPGAEEDRQGFPFVGRAGELLNSLLRQIGWRREDVYICNILKCRPPNNRDPLPEEVSLCEPFLHEQLRLLDPEWVVALGRVAAQVLLGTTAPLKALRGKVHKYRDKSFWVTYHPAALLRNMNFMPDAHQDLLTLKNMVKSGYVHGEDEP